MHGSIFPTVLLTCGLLVPHTLTFAQATWKRVHGAFANDSGVDMCTTADGHLVVVGSTGSFGSGSADVYAVKLDTLGNVLWSATYGGAEIDRGLAVAGTPDGGAVIAGFSNRIVANGYDGILMRISPEGQVLWETTLGGGAWDFLYDVAITADEGLVAVGQTFEQGSGDVWVVRTDAAGDTLWTRTLGGAGVELANAVVVLDDGGIALTGSGEVDGQTDALVVLLDAEGGAQWSRAVGGDSLDVGNDIIRTIDGRLSIVGNTRSYAQHLQHFHFLVDMDGNLVWSYPIGLVDDQLGSRHLQLPSGEFVSIGTTRAFGAGESDMYLMKTNGPGEFILGQTQGGQQSETGSALVRSVGGYILCGITDSFGSGGDDLFVVRTDEVGFTASDEVVITFDPLGLDEGDAGDEAMVVFPSPCTGQLQVRANEVMGTFRVHDMMGRSMLEQRANGLTAILNLSVETGTYLLTVVTESGRLIRRKFIVQANSSSGR